MRTSKGRVVYNRKRHVFRYSDLFRICRSFTPKSVILRVKSEDWRKIARQIALGGAKIAYDLLKGNPRARTKASIIEYDPELIEAMRSADLADIILLYKEGSEE